jgi:alkylation response protein AidB-like acyl-CoA dehydrogenase
MTSADQTNLKGGAFIISQTSPDQIFIQRIFNEEQQMIATTCHEFLEKEIWNRLDAIDSHEDLNLMPSLMDKAGELGLLGTSVPAEYGGLEWILIPLCWLQR